MSSACSVISSASSVRVKQIKKKPSKAFVSLLHSRQKEVNSRIKHVFQTSPPRRVAPKDKSSLKFSSFPSKISSKDWKSLYFARRSSQPNICPRKTSTLKYFLNMNDSDLQLASDYFFRFHFFSKWKNAFKRNDVQKLSNLYYERSSTISLSDISQFSVEKSSVQEDPEEETDDLAKIKERLIHKVDEKHDLMQQLSKINQELVLLNSELNVNIEELNQLKLKLKSCQSEKKVIGSKYESLKSEADKLHKIYEKLRIEKQELSSDISKSSTEIKLQKEELHYLKASIQQSSEELLNAKTTLEEKIKSISEVQEQIENAVQIKEQKEKELKKLRFVPLSNSNEMMIPEDNLNSSGNEKFPIPHHLVYQLEEIDSSSNDENSLADM